jgi:hypothetical protein
MIPVLARIGFVACWLAVLFLALTGWPQAVKSALPAITFSLDFPQSTPDHYVLAVSSDGRATYDSRGKLTAESDAEEPFHSEFTITPATRDKIFALAAKAKYFEAKLDSGKHNIASTGAKLLTYKDGQRNHEAAYNYSPIPAVQELTALFQNISTTLEFGRRLDYYHHYQKLGLEDELKRMEEMSNEKSLDEVQAIAPILHQIAADSSVINVTRARALRLLNANGRLATR